MNGHGSLETASHQINRGLFCSPAERDFQPLDPFDLAQGKKAKPLPPRLPGETPLPAITMAGSHTDIH